MASPEESQSAEQLLGDDHEALDQLLKALLAALDEAEMPTVFERLDLFWARLQRIHWPDLDEDLSVENLLLGKSSGESQDSFRRCLESGPLINPLKAYEGSE